MRSNSTFFALIIALLLGVIFVFFLNQKIAYLLFGYDPAIIGTGTVLAMEAARETRIASQIGFGTVFALTFIGLIVSGIALLNRYVSLPLVSVTFGLSLLLTILYTITAVITIVLPKRVV